MKPSSLEFVEGSIMFHGLLASMIGVGESGKVFVCFTKDEACICWVSHLASLLWIVPYLAVNSLLKDM